MIFKSETFTDLKGYKQARKNLLNQIREGLGYSGNKLGLPRDAITLYLEYDFDGDKDFYAQTSRAYEMEYYIETHDEFNGQLRTSDLQLMTR